METKHKVLVVDDNEIVIEALTEGLRAHGYEASSSTNGWEAMKTMFNGDYDAILLDVNMPQMDGITTVKALRKSDPCTYVLLISGEADEFKIGQALNNGANAFLPKPFAISALIKVLREIDFPRIAESKQVLRKQREQEIRRSMAFHRRAIRYLRSSGFRRRLLTYLVAMFIAGAVGYLAVKATTGNLTEQRKDVYMEKMDELIDVIRQDWGR